MLTAIATKQGAGFDALCRTCQNFSLFKQQKTSMLSDPDETGDRVLGSGHNPKALQCKQSKQCSQVPGCHSCCCVVAHHSHICPRSKPPRPQLYPTAPSSSSAALQSPGLLLFGQLTAAKVAPPAFGSGPSVTSNVALGSASIPAPSFHFG